MPRFSNPVIIKVSIKVPKPKDDRYPKDLNTIGDHLLKFRLDNGLLQKDLADRLQISITTLSNWERNRTIPKATYWPLIINALGHLPEIPGHRLLKPYRLKKGLSQKKLAQLIGVDEETIIRFEKGKPGRRQTQEKIQEWINEVAKLNT